MRVFVSYNFQDEEFAATLSHLLRKQPGIETFLYADEKRTESWRKHLAEVLNECNAFLYLAGETLGKTQEWEVNWHLEKGEERNQRRLYVILPNGKIPDHLMQWGSTDPVRCPPDATYPADTLAREISKRLTGAWYPNDGVPLGYLFGHEKKIIAAYPNGKLDKSEVYLKLLESGCPLDWPKVVKREAHRQNDDRIQKQIGEFGEENSEIIVTARTSYVEGQLSFNEARPRQWHRYPLKGQAKLKVGIVVSGGIAPGINAVIHGIVKRHELYHSVPSGNRNYHLEILGYRGGLRGLIADNGLRLGGSGESDVDVGRQAEMGGSLLATSRWDHFVDATTDHRDQLLHNIVSQLRAKSIDILYVIGGDGSMRAAHAIWKKAQETEDPAAPFGGELSVVGIPKTVDNDILWVWQSFGFLSAVEKAREEILNMHTEAESNPRLCILQLFGSDSGFVASHAGLASGVCDAVLIPEVDYSMQGLFKHLEPVLQNRYNHQAAHGLVLMGETALPCDALSYIDGLDDPAVEPADKDLRVRLTEDEKSAVVQFFQQGRRVRGQTPDHLRKGGLEIVSGVLQKMIKRMPPVAYWGSFRVFTSEPRHLIRSVRPSTADVIFAERLGTLAVDNAMAGYTDFMVSQWLTEYVLVPLQLAILGRKRVPPNGIFWKSVLASTGQPPDMVTSNRATS